MNFGNFIFKAVIVSFLVLPGIVSGQSITETVSKLEAVYKNAAGVEIAFSLDDGSKVSMILSSTSNAYKLTSKKDLYVSDATTLWHVLLIDKKVMIDNVKKDANTVNAQALLDFSHNYDASLGASKNGVTELTLTPHANVAPMFKSVGEVSAVTFLLKSKGTAVVVNSITALSQGSKITLGKLRIKPMKKIPAGTFTYTAPKDIQVMDLRD